MDNSLGTNSDIIQAISILALMAPFILTLMAANLSLRVPKLRWLAYSVVVLLSGSFLLIGLASLIMAAFSPAADRSLLPGMGFTPRWRALGWWSLLTGMGALFALTPAIRRAAQRLLPSFDATNPVHAVSLSFTSFLIGITATQLVMLGGLDRLAESDIQLGPAEVWAQGIGLALLGLAGIGLGTRRSWQKTAARLKIRWPTGRTMLIALVFVGIFMVIDFTWTRVWELIDPTGLETVSRVSRTLFGNMLNIPGALSIGITAAIGEEIIYRGALQPRFGLVFTAALFAVSHVQYGVSLAILEVFVIGLLLGLVRDRYDLTTCMLIHFGYNTLNLLILPPQ